MEHHSKYTQYSENEMAKMAEWIRDYWRQCRDSRNQTVFAKEVLDMSQPAFNQLLKGARPIPEQHFVALCKALNIPANDFFEILNACPTYRRRIVKFLMDAHDLRSMLGDWYKPLLVQSRLID